MCLYLKSFSFSTTLFKFTAELFINFYPPVMAKQLIKIAEYFIELMKQNGWNCTAHAFNQFVCFPQIYQTFSSWLDLCGDVKR